MKFIKQLAYLFLLALVVSSCGKENIDNSDVDVVDPIPTTTEVNPLINRSSVINEDGFYFDCFTILYPFSLVDVNAVNYEVASDDDLNTLFLDETLDIIDFVYPLNLVDDNGEESTADDGEELAEAFASCVPSGGWEEGDFPAYLINFENSCYSIVYPISLEKLSGEIVEVDSEEAFNAVLATEPVFFVFPIDLVHEDGDQISVSDIDEIFEVLIACSGFETGDTTGWDWENGFEYIGCYHVLFPLDVVVANGDVVTVNNHMELCDLMLVGEIVGYAFPLTLIDEAGQVIVVNSEEELNGLIDDCYEVDLLGFDQLFILSEGVFIACYDVTYPIQIEMLDSSIVDINSDDELEETIINGAQNVCCLVFPIQVTYVSSGDVESVEDTEDLLNLLFGC